MKEYKVDFIEHLGLQEISLKRELSKSVAGELLLDPSVENTHFKYRIVTPDKMVSLSCVNKAIILFHGLNERSWDKYFPWARYITEKTNLPVILFPISMHINRSSKDWSNPRIMQSQVVEEKLRRKNEGKDADNLTFVNFALSSRIKSDPYRFYLAGRETIYNLWQFMAEIRSGNSVIFDKKCRFNIFSYSIGSLLSQVLLMSDPCDYFADSALFMFCGGSLFSYMNGNSRMIMDRDSFEVLYDYYRFGFVNEILGERLYGDSIEDAFFAHIHNSFKQKEREKFYTSNYGRIKAIALNKDKVIPVSGIKMALGVREGSILEEMDFPFDYTHESPFPVAGKGDSPEAQFYFKKVFDQASSFLKQ